MTVLYCNACAPQQSYPAWRGERHSLLTPFAFGFECCDAHPWGTFWKLGARASTSRGEHMNSLPHLIRGPTVSGLHLQARGG